MNDLHSFSTPPRRLGRFIPTEKFSERKRALFPNTSNKENEDDSSDIGTMEPLELSSSPERYDSPFDSPSSTHSPFSNTNTFSALFEKITPLKLLAKHRENEVILAPNSPISMIDSPKITVTDEIPETPTKFSPTQALKTPHDSSSVNTKVPKLVRKSLLDLTNVDKSPYKRKESPIQNTSLDTSLKVSKARTALFPENIVPAKSFYPSSIANYKPSKMVFSEPLYNRNNKNPKKSRSTMYLCSRKRISKKMCGEINAGVRHGIKRPKNKPKLTKTQLLQAAASIIDKSPLNSYLDSISNKENEGGTLSRDQLFKMDSLLKNISSNVDVFKAQPLTCLQETPKLTENNWELLTNHQSGVKRPASPEPDQNKKFFKSSRTNATVTINKNIKLKYDNGEMSLIEKQKRKRQKFDLDFDASDLNISAEDKLVDTSFSDILKCLEDDNNHGTQNNIVLKAHHTVSASENQILLHSEPSIIKDKLMSPTTLMGGLALNSPKNHSQKVVSNPSNDITKQLHISFAENMENQNKLYPIFYNNNKSDNESNFENKKESQTVQNLKKIWKPLSDDQMLLDAGQKKWGHTQCKECNFVYHHGDPEDEKMHYNYHNSVNVLRFHGWKNERIVTQLGMGHNAVKIILVQPGDSKIWWKKVKELIDVINRELGFVNVPLDENHCKVYIYIKNKQIQGCVVAESKTKAHKMLLSDGPNSVDKCSEETFPVLCGISRIWTSVHARKQGVATTLMNSLRCNYIYGHALSTKQIAFSSPTDAGKAFITKYTGTQEYLVYMS